MNIRVPGDFSKICWSELRNWTRYTAMGLSRASIYTNVLNEGMMTCSIFTISGNRDLCPPIAFPSSRKARGIFLRNFSSPLNVGLEKPVANWAKHGEADAEEYPVLRRWRKKVSPVAGALRGHSS